MTPCRAGLSCVRLAGPLEGSGYGYCAAAAVGQVPVDTGNVAGGLMGIMVARRWAIDGNQCRLPIVYRYACPWVNSA